MLPLADVRDRSPLEPAGVDSVRIMAAGKRGRIGLGASAAKASTSCPGVGHEHLIGGVEEVLDQLRRDAIERLCVRVPLVTKLPAENADHFA